MKLPRYTYAGTDRLAKRDARAAMQDINVPVIEHRARMGVLNQVRRTTDQVYKAYQQAEKAKAAAEYNEAWVAANYEEQNLRASLEGGTISREEVERLGVPVPENMKEADLVPTAEVYLPYYEARMAEIRQETMEGLNSPEAKSRFDGAWANVEINMRNAAINKHVSKQQEVAQAAFGRVLREQIKNGNEALASASIDQMQALDVVSLEEAEKLRAELPAKIDQAQINQVLIEGNQDNLEQLLANLRGDVYRVTDEKKLSAMSKANTMLNRMESQDEKVHNDIRKRNASRDFLLAMEGELTLDDIRSNSWKYRPEDQVKLGEAIIRQQKGTGFNDPGELMLLRMSAEQIMFPPQGISMTTQATEVLRAARDSWIRGQITKESYDELKSTINDNRNVPYKTEDYKTVERTISKTFGVAVDRISLLLSAERAGVDGVAAMKDIGAKERTAAIALEDLRAAIRLQGMELDPMEWWAKNKSNYSLETSLKGAAAQFDQSYGAIKMPDGRIDVEATRRKVFEQEMKGLIDSAERDRRIHMLDGETYAK